jgi:hypothetical protein
MTEQVTLTAGQKAALTRAANKANGTVGQTSAKSPETPRADGLVVQMWITVHEHCIQLSFDTVNADGKSTGGSGLAPSEAALSYLQWRAWPDHSSAGELGGFELCSLKLSYVGVALLEMALPLMRRCDKMIELARDQSDDLTFAFVASTLAAHFRAASVHVRMVDGSTFAGKRGAAYVTALRLSDAFLANRNKPASKPEKAKPEKSA